MAATNSLRGQIAGEQVQREAGDAQLAADLHSAAAALTVADADLHTALITQANNWNLTASNIYDYTSLEVMDISNRLICVSNDITRYIDIKVFGSNQIGRAAVTKDTIAAGAVHDEHIDSVSADKITGAPWLNRGGDSMTGTLATKGLQLYGDPIDGYMVSGVVGHPEANGFYNQIGTRNDFPLYGNQHDYILYVHYRSKLYSWNIAESTGAPPLYSTAGNTTPILPSAVWPAGISVSAEAGIQRPIIDMAGGRLQNLIPAEQPHEPVTLSQFSDGMTAVSARDNNLEMMIDLLYTYVQTCTTGQPSQSFGAVIAEEIDFSNFLSVTNATMSSGYLTLANEPEERMHAVTKHYVDTTIASAVSNSPGTFSGPVHAWSRGEQTLVTCDAGVEPPYANSDVWQSFTLEHDCRLKSIAFQPANNTGGDFLHVQLFAGLPDSNNHIREFYLDYWPTIVQLHFNDLALTAGVYSLQCQYLDGSSANLNINLAGTYGCMTDPYPGGSYCGISDFDAWLEINYDLDSSTIGQGIPDHNLGSNGLYVTGSVEIDQTAYFDGGIMLEGKNISDMFLRKDVTDEQIVLGPVSFKANGDWTVGAAGARSDIVIAHPEARLRSEQGDLTLSAGDNDIVAKSRVVFDNPQAGKVTIPGGQASVQVTGVPVSMEAVIIVTPCQPVESTPYVIAQPDGTFVIGLPFITEEPVSLNYMIVKP